MRHHTVLQFGLLITSLVFAQKPVQSPKAGTAPGSGCASAVHLEAFHLDLSSPAAPETADKKSTKPLDSQEQEKWSQNKDLDEPSPGKDHISKGNANQPFVPQYLYVQPAAGKGRREIYRHSNLSICSLRRSNRETYRQVRKSIVGTRRVSSSLQQFNDSEFHMNCCFSEN